MPHDSMAEDAPW